MVPAVSGSEMYSLGRHPGLFLFARRDREPASRVDQLAVGYPGHAGIIGQHAERLALGTPGRQTIASPSPRARSGDTIGTRDVIVILPLIVSRSSFALLWAANLTSATGPLQRRFGVGAIAVLHCNPVDATRLPPTQEEAPPAIRDHARDSGERDRRSC